MRIITRYVSWALLLILFAPEAFGQQTSNCPRSLGEAYLDINQVRARILNTGGLFYRGEPHVYEIPKGSGSNAIFASGIWLAGTVGGQLRAAATRYGEWEFWAGPLDDAGNPPADCTVYDRLYKVNRADVEEFDATGSVTPDLRDWPTGLGAPTLDADGNLIEVLDQPLASRVDRKINLAAGERPALLGDQSIWWVMNDRGNTHESSDAPAIGIEAQVMAFAFDVAGPVGNSTFYKYNLFYKGNVPLENAYLGIFSDPDLGDFADDYVGSDTTLGLGYVYNADNSDESGEGYGTPPPAAGYDFFQGPIVPSPGDTASVSGTRIPDFRNLKMTHFVFYNNGGGVTEDPQTGPDYYNYLRGNWKDGQKITLGGNGRDFSEIPTDYMFTGDPAAGEFWSEVNSDGNGTAIEPADRRFVMSTGPFTINPGDQQEIVFGVVWALGADHLDSVAALRRADDVAQAAYDAQFILPQPPASPDVVATERDGQILLEWSNSARSNNFLESYREFDPFSKSDYVFEGYKVIQYADVADTEGQIIATYDVPNGVTRIIEGLPGEPTGVTANGSDSGVQNFHSIGGLTNYKTYIFGIQAYGYSETAIPSVYDGPINKLTVIPTKSRQVTSEAAEAFARDGASGADVVVAPAEGNVGQGVVEIDIVNPNRVQAATYSVEFFEVTTDKVASRAAQVETDEVDGQLGVAQAPQFADKSATCTSYNINKDGTPVFDGTEFCAPQRDNIVVIDGMNFSVTGPDPGISDFQVVANAGGPLDPPDCGTFAFNGWGYPLEACGSDRPSSSQQTNGSTWGFSTGQTGGCSSFAGSCGPYAAWIGRTLRNGAEALGVFDYEMRFTGDNTGLAVRGFEDGAVVDVPFTLWQTGVATPNDSADDVQMVPVMCELACGSDGDPFVYDLGTRDHDASGGANDPYTDWIYWYYAENGPEPGTTGYEGFFFGDLGYGSEIMARTVLVNWNGGTVGPERNYDSPRPEDGTVFRITTFKPNQPGDVFAFNAADFNGANLAVRDRTAEENVDALELIGVVPNPYMGASAYERSQLIDQVRFTNLPEVADIRIFTLNGTLINTLQKRGSGRTLAWNLTTNNNLPIASGLYLIHVDVPGVGEKVIKFAAVKKRIQLNVF